ncbi:MAG TPA: hypothetical protein EYP10_01515, partial [Armatimonadetes bacterium]|nr:hypothetical protein [Armatimonadota bacterium]
MSGSPIYVNGKLIGALAYGWMFSRLPIAGVTPIESMVESATPAPTHFSKLWDDGVTFVPRDGKIRIGRQRIRRVVIAGRGYISKRAHVPRDEIVLTPIRTPLMVSGISGIALERLRALLQPFGLEPVAAPGKPYNANKIKASLEPGAAVGAQMVSGDIDLTAVGTVTYRKGNLLIAFGHPFMLAGSIQMPLTTAYVHGVLPSELMSIKLASPLRPLGAFTEDRAFAIAGKLGLRADMLPVVMTMRDLNRHVQRQYRVAVFRHRDLTIPLINLLLSIAFMNVTSISNSGTTRIAYEIFTDGLPPIRRSNLFIQRRAEGLLGMILSYFIGPTAELVQLLETLQDNRFKPVNIKQVRVLMENTQQRREAYIERVWCDKRVVRPGEDVTLHVFLREVHGDVVERTFKVQVPERMPATTIRIGVAGGEHGARLRSRLGILQRRPLSLKQLIEEFMRRERNDEIVICMQLPNMGGWLNGALTENVPYSVLEMFNAIADDNFYVGYVGKIQRISCSNVVHGMKIVTIRVRPEWVKETPKPSASLRRARGRAFEDLFETFEELRRILGGKGSTMPFQRTLMCKSRTRWLLKHLEYSPDANALSRNV